MKTNEEKQKSKGLTTNDLRPSQWCRLVTTAMESGYAIDGELWTRGEAGRGGGSGTYASLMADGQSIVAAQTIFFFYLMSLSTCSYFGPGGGWRYHLRRRAGVC